MGVIFNSLAAVVTCLVGITLVVGAVLSVAKGNTDIAFGLGGSGLIALFLAFRAFRKVIRIERVRKGEEDAARNADGVVVAVSVTGWACNKCQSREIDRTPPTGAPVSVYQCRECDTRQVKFSARVGLAAAGALFSLVVVFAAWKAVDDFGTANGRRALGGAVVISPLAYFCFTIAALPTIRKAHEDESF